MNFRELPQLIDHARAMALDGISFLAADVSSSAFGRERPGEVAADLALDRGEIEEFSAIVERTIARRTPTTSSRDSSPSRRRSCAGCRSTTTALASGAPLRARRLQRAVGVGGRRGERRRPAVLLPRADRQHSRRAARVDRRRTSCPGSGRAGRRERSGLRTVRVLDQGRVEKPAVAVSVSRTTRGARSTAWRRIITARTPTTRLLRAMRAASDGACCCGTWPRGSHVLDLGLRPGNRRCRALAARGYTRDRDRRVAGDGRRGAPARGAGRSRRSRRRCITSASRRST